MTIAARQEHDLAPTFIEFAETVLAERERGGIKDARRERSRFENHLRPAPFASTPIRDVSGADIEHWVRAMMEKRARDARGVRPLSSSTIERSFFLVSAIFEAAGTEGARLIDANPCHQVRLPKILEGHAKKKPWDWLTLDEQKAIAACSDIPDADRLVVLFAIGTGLRAGEQFNLRISDLDLAAKVPHVTVRLGSGGHQQKERQVRLLGPSLDAAREWLQLLPEYAPHNPQRLLFPTPGGNRRPEGKPLGRSSRLRALLSKAGVRSVRWTDLRHTCGVSMRSGWWGRVYDIKEIQTMLGHSQISQTDENYSRFGRSAVSEPRTTGADSETSSIRTSVAPSIEVSEDGRPPIPEPSGWRTKRLDIDAGAIAPFAAALALPSETIARVAVGLSIGKHLLLVGPPGTGKTELAHAVVNAARAGGYCAGAHVSTASADWTTYDTIGGYAVEQSGRLRFRSGALLRAIEEYEWLVIDELNRADVDRAFGELMTVLAGRTTDTPYELDNGDRVRIGPDPSASHFMPPTFRVIATMNTWDKTSLFRLSYAVQRRFAIVNVGVPSDKDYGALLLRHACHVDSQSGSDPPLEPSACEAITRLFSRVGLLAAREIGPAIAIDVVRYARRRLNGSDLRCGDALSEALAVCLLPQLENLSQEHAVTALAAIVAALALAECSPQGVAELRERFVDLLPHVAASA